MRERKQPLRPDDEMQLRTNATRTGPALDRDIQVKIGQQLRAVYDDIVDQGVPDRFIELLRDLEREGRKEGRGDKDASE